MKYKLLVVDDESRQVKSLANIIKQLRPEYEVYIAYDGQEALDFILKNPIDILVTDIMMPNIDGLQLIERLFDQGFHIKTFELYFKPVDRKSPDIVALNYGPIVLATDEMVELIGDMDNPEGWIHPVGDKWMVFKTEKGHVAGYDFATRVFTPYCKINEMNWYFMYNRIHKQPPQRPDAIVEKPDR